MKYHIYQTNADYKFMQWNTAKSKFSMKDYHEVYSDKLPNSIMDDKIVLDKLFERFNINHPIDYKERSMSVSDVVTITRKNKSKYYYCESLGWKFIGGRLIS